MKDQLMNEGSRIRFDRNGEIWLVSKQFMSGAFGEVFRLVNKNNETRVMKMEARISPEEAQHHICRLKVESLVLKSMNEVEGFPKLFHCGRTKSHNYIVMEHLGPDLNRIRRSLPRKRFTIHTAMRISADVLKRLEALHLSGWIYRDVKPQNFAVGIGEKSSTVYILDFGMTRRAKEKERRAAPAAGTFRYMSLRTNSYKEQSYRDDLESWIYMTIELVAGKLPWSTCATIELYPLITDMKNYGRHRAGRKELFAAFPSQFEEIFDIILKLGYHEVPDYERIKVLFGQVVNIMKVDQDMLLDWQEDANVIRCASKIRDCGESNYLPALLKEVTQYIDVEDTIIV